MLNQIPEKCPRCNGNLILTESNKTINFKGKNLNISYEEYLCGNCSLNIGTIEQTAATQKAILKAYKEKLDSFVEKIRKS